MDTGRPRTALAALTWRRLPVSGWPWRSAGYLATGLPVAVPAFTVLGIPWLVLTTRLSAGHLRVGEAVFLVLLGTALIGLLGPLVTVHLGGLERRRLRLVDDRPVASPRQPVSGGPVSWLRARYTDPAAWREVGYACLLATVAPVLSIAALLVALLAVLFLASPFLIMAQRPGDGPVAVGVGQVATVEQTVPYVIAGAVLAALLPYLLALLAGGHAAVARALLSGSPAGRLRAELTEVRRSRARLAGDFEAERRRIERDLHDGAQQQLVSLTMQLGLARLDVPPDSPAADSLAAAHAQAKQLMARLRELIHGIQPQILTDLGLGAALGELADQSPVPVAFDAHLAGRLPGPLEHTAYFVAAEALTNVAEHSGATRAHLTARRHDDVLIVEIGDDGHGGADPDRGTGLTGLADRVAVAGGRLLLSSPDGGPTLLRVELPCTHHQPQSG